MRPFTLSDGVVFPLLSFKSSQYKSLSRYVIHFPDGILLL